VPFDPAAIKQLADAGGWTVAIAEAIVIAVLLLRGGAKRWWVFGWLYDRAIERAEKAETQLERTVDALHANTATQVATAQALAVAAKAANVDHAKILRAVDALRDDLHRGTPSAPPR